MIGLSLSLDKVVLMFSTNIYFFKLYVLISNQNTIEIFKGVVLTIFLAFLPIGADI
jgi:hypothetical protein